MHILKADLRTLYSYMNRINLFKMKIDNDSIFEIILYVIQICSNGLIVINSNLRYLQSLVFLKLDETLRKRGN